MILIDKFVNQVITWQVFKYFNFPDKVQGLTTYFVVKHQFRQAEG